MFLFNCAVMKGSMFLCAYACYRKPLLLLLHRQRLLHSKYCSILAPFHKSSTPLKSWMFLFMALHQTLIQTHMHKRTLLPGSVAGPLHSAQTPRPHRQSTSSDTTEGSWWREESRRPESHSYTSTQHQNNSRDQQVARWRLSGSFPPPARTWRVPPVADDAPLQQPGDFSDVSPDCAASYTLPPSSPGTTPGER